MPDADDRITPARAQYLRLKQKHPDALLLFRMGDFYEMFDDDAVTASRDLHITLTGRSFGKGARVPMAGVPHHALGSYLRRLLAKGHRVAICEQLSEAGHGLVERDVVKVLSPGTVVEPGLLAARENNYLVALYPNRDGVGLAYVDVTTAEFAHTSFAVTDAAALAAELARLAPAECLLPEGSAIDPLPACPISYCPPRWFGAHAARDRLLRHFGTASLEPLGCADDPLGAGAAAAVLAYVEGTNPDLLRSLRGLRGYSTSAYVTLDPHTRRNLELTRAARSGERSGSLLAVLDGIRTPMGGRLLRRWLARPLQDVAVLNRRLDIVEALTRLPDLRVTVATALERTGDIERLAGRARQGSATPRDLIALASGLTAAAPLTNGGDRQSVIAGPLLALLATVDPASDVANLIGCAISDEAGRRIRPGYDAELDQLTAVVSSAQRSLLEIEQQERERTGIRTLKVGFNKVFGYYIEVSKSQLKNVPADFQRKQTLANGERYITSPLKDWESRILRAEEQITTREDAVYREVLDATGAAVDRLLTTAAALSELDVLAAFADLAVQRRYVRPLLDTSDVIDIAGGRHPVVEAALDDGAFIGNDTHLAGALPSDADEADDGGDWRDTALVPATEEPGGGQSVPAPGRVVLVTGPNMAGKSTYLRQTALIVLLAQVGCFVPAASARIGVVDRIFTRIGAQDDLAAGASTFLVEMVETAAILRQAGRRSLLIFDEIGRGTSTFDGLAIAQAVIEDVHDRIGARTLFATHFHELTALAERMPALRNAHMAATEEDGRVVFLRRLEPGGADRSYGIHVARLAGLPEHVTARAQELLTALHQPAFAADRAVAEAAATYTLNDNLDARATVFAETPSGFNVEELLDGVRPAPTRESEPVPLSPGPSRPDPARYAQGWQPRGAGACPDCAVAHEQATLAGVRDLNLAATTPIQAMNALFTLQERLRQTPVCREGCRHARPRLMVVEPPRVWQHPAAP